MAQDDHLMLRPLFPALHWNAARHSDLVAGLQRAQFPPAIDGIERVVRRRFDLVSQACCQAINRLHAVIVYATDRTGIQL